MISLHQHARALLMITLAIACGTVAIMRPWWLAELRAQSYFLFEGRAEKLGTTNAKVAVEGEFTFNGIVGDLRNATVTIHNLLNEVGVDLIAGTSLPITLFPGRGGKATAVIFRTPDRVRPSFWMELKNRGGGVFTFRLVVEFASSMHPVLCAGRPRRTTLTTSFTIMSPTATVGAVNTQAWECLAADRELRVREP